MSELKKCKVAMLPIKKAIKGCIIKDTLSTQIGDQILENVQIGLFDGKPEPKGLYSVPYVLQPQHLYICSTDEIKEGEYGINQSTGSIFQLLKKNQADKDNYYPWWDVKWITGGNLSNSLVFFENSGARPIKVIATTDSSLMKTIKVQDDAEALSYQTDVNLPTVSDAFISKYISEYNKGNIIEDVMVEYEVFKYREGNLGFKTDYQLKLRVNEIIITKVNDKNPKNLQVGRIYWMKYLPCKSSKFEKCTISRFTQDGFAWAVFSDTNGIVSQELYEISEVEPKEVKDSWNREEVQELLIDAINWGYRHSNLESRHKLEYIFNKLNT